MKRPASITINALAIPVIALTNWLHKKFPWLCCKKTTHLVLSVSIMCIGVALVDFLGHYIGHYLADVIGFWVHGFGGAPLVKMAADFFKLEV